MRKIGNSGRACVKLSVFPYPNIGFKHQTWLRPDLFFHVFDALGDFRSLRSPFQRHGMLHACFNTRQVQQQWLRSLTSCPWFIGDAWRLIIEGRPEWGYHQPLSIVKLINDGEVGTDKETSLEVVPTENATKAAPANAGPRQERELDFVCTNA